jgi:glutamine synthetase
MADQPQTADDIQAFVEDRDIRFVRLWFTDVLGQLKSFSINAQELEDAFEGGMGFDGSSITGFNAIEESDMIAMPDASTFAILPWRPEDKGVARVALVWLASRGDDVAEHARHASHTRATRATCCGARSSARLRWASRTSTSGRNSSTSTSGARSLRPACPRCWTRAATST